MASQRRYTTAVFIALLGLICFLYGTNEPDYALMSSAQASQVQATYAIGTLVLIALAALALTE